MAEEMSTAPVKRQRFRWLLGWKARIMLLLVVLAAGAWWYFRTPEFVLVERTPLPVRVEYSGGDWTMDLFHSTANAAQSPEQVLVFGDKGILQPPSIFIRRVLSPDQDRLGWCWSAHRRYLAVLDEKMLYLWHEGKQLYEQELPNRYTDLHVLDSGQVLCWSRASRRLCCNDKGRVVAQGMIPRLTAKPEWQSFSSDAGVMLVADSRERAACYQVAITGKRITFTPQFVAKESPSTFSPPATSSFYPPPTFWAFFNATPAFIPVFAGGDRILFDNGALYGPLGKISGADGWMRSKVSVIPSDPSLPAVMQARQAPGHPGQVEYRSLNVHTGKHWIIPHAPPDSCFLITPDGRFAAYSGVPSREKMTRLRAWLTGKPVLKYLAKLISKEATPAIDLYEQPGRLRARLHYTLDQAGSCYIDPRTKIRYTMENIRLSPDGHSLLITMHRGEDNAQRELWRFRW